MSLSAADAVALIRQIRASGFVVSPPQAWNGWTVLLIDPDESEIEYRIAEGNVGWMVVFDVGSAGWGFSIYQGHVCVCSYACDWSRCTLARIDTGTAYCEVKRDGLDYGVIGALVNERLPDREWLTFDPSSRPRLKPAAGFAGSVQEYQLKRALDLPGACEDLEDMQPPQVFVDTLSLDVVDDDYETLYGLWQNDQPTFNMLYQNIEFVQ